MRRLPRLPVFTDGPVLARGNRFGYVRVAMARINEHYAKLPASYLFPEIGRRVKAYAAAHPDAKVIRLGIGDVTEPLAPAIVSAMHAAVDEMAKRETFKGYGPEQGYDFLIEAIREHDYAARGVDLAAFGPAVSDPVRLTWPEVREVAGTVAGSVVHVDRFGNLITSIHAAPLGAVGNARIRIAGKEVPLAETYADLPSGRAGALIGSRNRLEIAVREGSAAALLRAGRGTPVVVSSTTASTRKRPRRSP